MKILSILFILSLFIFPYIKNLYEDNKFLNEEIKIIEYESSEKEKTINILQKDIFFLKEKLKEKVMNKEPKQELLPDFRISKDIFDFVTDLSDSNEEVSKQEKNTENNEKTIKEIKVGTQIPMVEIPQEIIDTTKTI
jgi:hypothetical protein